MSRVVFKTGKPHQENAAIWARQRLADDTTARRFSTPDDQDGVLFADSVGLGKTWEALAAAALILYKAKPQRARRHVLILCPANLVTKWEDELATGSRFNAKLLAWKQRLERSGHAGAANRVLDTLSHILPIRSREHVQVRKKYGTFHPPGGTYIVSQSLFVRKGRGLTALRREDWDVVIVDEAHNAAARKALKRLQERKRARTKLLLTATPFQLEPRQWNLLATNLLKRGHRVLNQQHVSTYIDQLADMFSDPNRPGPTKQVVKDASDVLRKIATRTIPPRSNRSFQLLLLNGEPLEMPSRLDEIAEDSVVSLLDRIREEGGAGRDLAFERSYFSSRAALATGSTATFVATKLRRLLSSGVAKLESPRRRALGIWASRSFAKDIEQAVASGLPRKTVVFTSWVGDSKTGEAAALQRLLGSAFDVGLAAVRKRHWKHWDQWQAAGAHRLNKAAIDWQEPELRSALEALARDELTTVLAGKSLRFVRTVVAKLKHGADALEETREKLRELDDTGSFEGRAVRRRIQDMRASLNPWNMGKPFANVERYTGKQSRTSRDRAATAFREVGAPWVLVASNVGSEGIDLHTYTSRIVHFDLEWNPARMEQREGRGDRVGRVLKDKLAVLYCVVPRTYDERMFHQLIARDRWHGVLLGKPATRLEDDAIDSPLVERKRLEGVRLDLSPPRIR